MKRTVDEIIDGLISEIKTNDKLNPKILDKNNDYASCNFVARSTGIISGTKISQLVYRKLSNKINFEILKKDGEFVNRGDVIAVISGPVDEILKGENLSLSFIRYMSGISSVTKKYELELINTGAILEYSSYATPGLEDLAINAFLSGGGKLNNNDKKCFVITRNLRARFDSYDEIIKKIKTIDKNIKLIIEISNDEELEEVLNIPGIIIRICSNKYEFMLQASKKIDKRKNMELLGEIDLKKIRTLAINGYSKFLIPSLTESAPSFPIDMCFYKRPKVKK